MIKNILLKVVIFVVLVIPIVSNANNLIKSDDLISTSGTLSFGFIQNQVNSAQRISTDLRNNVSAQIGLFDPWAGVYYERLITPFWGIDIAAGLIGGSIGTKIYIPRLSAGRYSFYTGISEGILISVGAKHYIPLGVTFLGNKGFRISFDLGPQIFHDKYEENQFGLTLKLGKSF